MEISTRGRHRRSRPHARLERNYTPRSVGLHPAMRLGYTPRCGRGTPREDSPRSLDVVLVIDLGIADEVLLIQHLGQVMEVLFDLRCKVRVMACRARVADQ